MKSQPDADGIINLIITKGTVTRIPIAFGYTSDVDRPRFNAWRAHQFLRLDHCGAAFA